MKKINNGEINESFLEKEIEVYGWVQQHRNFGKLTFIDLRDESGIIQIVVNDLEQKISNESVIKVIGVLKNRKDINEKIATGKFEIIASKLEVLNYAQELPFVIDDNNHVKEELSGKYRYLELRKPKTHEIITKRFHMIKAMRNKLEEKGFIEIETPILAKSTPEGARDFLVATRKAGHFYSLPQSPQLFKQLLMSSGFEKYYQVARVFRDEDGRKDRQPEFSQLDIEMSFQSPEILQAIVEETVQAGFKAVGIDIKIPFQRMDYDHAIKYYGSDKPDLRFQYLIEDAGMFFTNSEFDIISKKQNIKLIASDHLITKKDHKFLEQVVKKNGANILWYFNVENGELTDTNFAKKDLESVNRIVKHYQTRTKCFLIVAEDNYDKTHQALGAIRNELNLLFKLSSDEEYKFAWIVNWPLFEYDEKTDSYGPAHHAFTMYDKDTLVNGELDFVKTRARAYDLVLNGFEAAGGSERIYSYDIQRKIFEKIGLTDEQVENQFGFFINSFKYGLPPHCGIAFGLERMIMVATKSESIRDVIAFPKNSKAQDLLTGSPSEVTQEQLDEVFLEIKTK
ncbi:aspartate--tRNA ligase [Mycoplasmopsis agassizii]|uniref:Aspartate--tRNA ligase n=1 Tax=Mycoplasmopsis agassizii TaxID=33922 RepID=A0A269TK55_9BACT|nr:aspartate--tRNA ligase [Mycoplasmopsis agassizii]PAK21446.1 aspartate--tRNA ligase [Mycoplasmopsis agassizii]